MDNAEGDNEVKLFVN